MQSLGIRSLLSTLFVAVFAAPASAAIGPTFYMPSSAWEATHIVVTDGKGVVLESWEGDLKPGDTLPIGTFELPRDMPISKTASWHSGGRVLNTLSPEVPHVIAKAKAITGRRVVLFLKKGNGQGRQRAFNHGWQPTSYWEYFKVSAAWVEENQVFGLVQINNPGPSEMVLIGETEEAFRTRVFAVASGRQLFSDAMSVKEPGKRARRLAALVDNDQYTGGKVIAAIAECGPAGVVALGAMMANIKYDWAGQMIHGLLAKAGPAGGSELVAALAAEQAFWKPARERGLAWYNRHPETGKRYSRMFLLLSEPSAFAGLPSDDMRVLTEVQAHWSTDPVLAEFEKGQAVKVATRVQAAIPGAKIK
jgi:hypothetical protein